MGGQAAGRAGAARARGADGTFARPVRVQLQGLSPHRPLLCGQALDLAVLSLIYLPTFYVFKAAVFSDAATGFEPAGCISSGIEKYQANFAKAR